jgi:hypothetical protein
MAISTEKLHHRDPLGLKQLVTNKYYALATATYGVVGQKPYTDEYPPEPPILDRQKRTYLYDYRSVPVALTRTIMILALNKRGLASR